MPLEFIYLNSPPVVAVICDNRKAMGKEKWHKVKSEKSTKSYSIEFREQKKKKKKTHKKNNKNKQTNKQKKRQNGNQVLNQQIAKM